MANRIAVLLTLVGLLAAPAARGQAFHIWPGPLTCFSRAYLPLSSLGSFRGPVHVRIVPEEGGAPVLRQRLPAVAAGFEFSLLGFRAGGYRVEVRNRRRRWVTRMVIQA